MIHSAHASCFLWMQVGKAVNHQRGEWQVSRVYATLGNGHSALRHANYCLALTEIHQSEITDFDVAFACETVARANAIADNHSEAKRYIELAQSAGQVISDKTNREIFFADFNSGSWNSLK